MNANLLHEVTWRCTAVPAGAAETPDELFAVAEDWYPATVPGTAASAVRAAQGIDAALARDYDTEDWWFVTTIELSGSGPWVLTAHGLATVAEVWVGGQLVARSESMFTASTVALGNLPRQCLVALRFTALGPLLGQRRRPRARWRTALLREQGLRWWRTSLLGRAPLLTGTAQPVGPYRDVELVCRPAVEVMDKFVATGVRDAVGTVQIRAWLVLHEVTATAVRISVGSVHTMVGLEPDGDRLLLQAEIEVPDVALWWPHSHGDQPLYPVTVSIGEHRLDWGVVGFRELQVDRSDGAFTLSVNGTEVFCRGACWTPVDPVGLVPDAEAVRSTLCRAREAGFNMVRVTGTMLYEDAMFWRLCAQLGLLVWQDAMLSTFDPPDDPAFTGPLTTEIKQLCNALQGNPALAVLSGGSETEQQPALLGLSADRRTVDLIQRIIPEIVRELLPATPYVSSSPSGGPLPNHVGTGVAHYFGIGAYLRPLSDLTTSGVRFAAECLAFSIPPERSAVEEVFGSAAVAGHHPEWKAAVPRDNGASWDFEDVRDHYVREFFSVDPLQVRRSDPERYLDLGRAAVCEAMGHSFSYWRRAGSRCAGALVLTLRDLEPGAGWGLLDSDGNPKAPWYVLRRLCQPVALLVTDIGLDGVRIDLRNDHHEPLRATLQVSVYPLSGGSVLLAEVAVQLAARDGAHWSVDELAGAFLDLNHAFGFGPRAYTALSVRLFGAGGEICGATHLLGGSALPLESDVGLTATLLSGGDRLGISHTDRAGVSGCWSLTVGARRTAQYVCVDVPGYLPDDSWFHLLPGGQRRVQLRPIAGTPTPCGYVRALNSSAAAPVIVES